MEMKQLLDKKIEHRETMIRNYLGDLTKILDEVGENPFNKESYADMKDICDWILIMIRDKEILDELRYHTKNG